MNTPAPPDPPTVADVSGDETIQPASAAPPAAEPAQAAEDETHTSKTRDRGDGYQPV